MSNRRGRRLAQLEPQTPCGVSANGGRTMTSQDRVPEQQKEDSRRRQESGQSGGERRPEIPEKGDARRDRGGPGQQGKDDRPEAPEDKRDRRGSERR